MGKHYIQSSRRQHLIRMAGCCNDTYTPKSIPSNIIYAEPFFRGSFRLTQNQVSNGDILVFHNVLKLAPLEASWISLGHDLWLYWGYSAPLVTKRQETMNKIEDCLPITSLARSSPSGSHMNRSGLCMLKWECNKTLERGHRDTWRGGTMHVGTKLPRGSRNTPHT